jgi:transcriptional regulator with XRE-family HTH domain
MLFRPTTIKDVKNQTAALARSLRKNKGLSQEQLAEALGLSRITIQNLEAGKNTTLETLLKVLQYFDTLDKFNQFIENNIEDNSWNSLY